MAEETYTREQLEDMHRLHIRKICKARGKSAEECATMKFEDMVDWILENQEGGGGDSKSRRGRKTTKKASAKGKTKAASKKTSEKTPPRAARKKRVERDLDGPEDAPTGEVVGDDLVNVLLEKFADLADKIDVVEEKVDAIGELMDKNTNGILDSLNEVRSDTYGIVRRQVHSNQWLEDAGILTEDEAPDGLNFEALEEAIEEECSGNDDGDA